VAWTGITSGGPTSHGYTDWFTAGMAANEDGDTHVVTVNGVRYDFQAAGEFVALRGTGGLEIQTRMAAVSTASTITDAYDGLATCVSLNTAVAARVGKHRVTFQAGLGGEPDPAGLQIRVDGRLVRVPPEGLDLGGGGRVSLSAASGIQGGSGIQVRFPDDTLLVATPNWWASQSRWYLNVDVFDTLAAEGIMGAIAPGSWLPRLPGGASLGAMPGPLPDRYQTLYRKFGDAWRVTPKTSLFDYAPGTSTQTFTLSTWPPEQAPCEAKGSPPTKGIDRGRAEGLCREIAEGPRRANCVFDVAVTGEPGFVKLYRASERVRLGATFTTLATDRASSMHREGATFTAAVRLLAPRRGVVPRGAVLFSVDGARVGKAVGLDKRGVATWRAWELRPGRHEVTARYLPAEPFLPSDDALRYTVRDWDETPER
jgi:hypothetical protein